ncbi:MAG: mercury resistance system transport protein MerF [Rhodobacterales bacterium]
MNDKKLLRRGMIGSVIAALCCFTPLLVLVFAGVGLSAYIGWLDYALFPLMFASLAVVAYALWLQSGKLGPNPKSIVTIAAIALSALLIWLEFRMALRISIGSALGVALYALWLRRSATNSPVK